jgi:hypothetical protein
MATREFSTSEIDKNRHTNDARVALVIGLFFGVLSTLGAFLLFRLTAPHQVGGDFSTFVLLLVSIPTDIFCGIFRFSLHLAKDNGHGGSSDRWSIPAICLVTSINGILISILGWWLGKLLKHRKKGPR